MYRKALRTLCIAVVALLFSCSTEEVNPDYIVSGLNRPIVTGYFGRDIQGSIIYTKGDPNVNTEYDLNGDGSYQNFVLLISTPNPANHSLKINLINLPPGCNFYVLNATTDGSLRVEGTFMQSTNMVSGTHKIIEIKNISEEPFIDTSHWPEGYYRAYLQGDNFLLWDNIVVDHTNNNNY